MTGIWKSGNTIRKLSDQNIAKFQNPKISTDVLGVVTGVVGAPKFADFVVLKRNFQVSDCLNQNEPNQPKVNRKPEPKTDNTGPDFKAMRSDPVWKRRRRAQNLLRSRIGILHYLPFKLDCRISKFERSN